MKGLQAEEYSRLCAEIDNNGIRIFNILAIAFTAYSAIFVFGIEKKNPLMLLATLIPIIPVFFMIAAQYNSTNRISTYIRMFYEENKENKISWEKSLAELRSKKGYKSNYQRAIQLILIVLGLTSLLSSLYFFCDKYLSQPADLQVYLINNSAYLIFAVIDIFGYVRGYYVMCKAAGNYKKYLLHWKSLASRDTSENNKT